MNCHSKHDSIAIDINLTGIPENLPDVCSFENCQLKFKMKVFDWEKYANTEGLCPADDIVSRSLVEQGVWEAYETLLMLDILTKNQGLVVDIGSQVGWYSLIAALGGCPVVAYDALEENIKIIQESARLNKLDITTHQEWIGEETQEQPVQEIRFLKSDIEGNEQYVFKMYKRSFKARTIDYALLEISPCFNDSYPKLIKDIMDCGYDVYQVPGKRWEHTEEFSKEPLQTLFKYPIIKNLDEYIRSVRQENFLFVRQDEV